MLKAIETRYKGYRFRSRLEARWAVFFDEMNVPYEYEKEGYDLDGLWYLPDFWLPELKIWIEIKGDIEDEKTAEKITIQCGRLSFHSQCPVALVIKDPMDARCIVFEPKEEKPSGGIGAVMYNTSFLGLCPACGRLGLGVAKSQDTVNFLCSHNGLHELKAMSPKEERQTKRKLFDAANTARSARFDHGETPKIQRGKLRKG